MNKYALIINVALCILYSCSRSGNEDLIETKPQINQKSIQQQQALNASAATMDNVKLVLGASSPKPAQEDRLRGKVVETMNSGGYTYVSILASSGETFWAAGRKTIIKVGEMIDLKKEMEMTNFTSNTLGRTFKSIYFVSSLKGSSPVQLKPEPRSRFPKLSAPAVQSGGPGFSQRTHGQSTNSKLPAQSSKVFSLGSNQPNVSGHAQLSPPRSAETQVKKAEGGYTIAELFAQAHMLAGKEVMVRSKVVKFNSGIMDKNWVHIQDGTGNVANKTHDLTVTSDQIVSVGETVLVKGQLTIDRNIGAGYKYPVMIEQAKFIR